MIANKVLTKFNLDLSDLPADTETRDFSIVGDEGLEFILEIKNEDNYYYNFTTNLFQAADARLDGLITNNNLYKGIIKFPTVTDDDQYDIFLYVLPGGKHANYQEFRFRDGSIDINSSVGSNSLMMQKVIYQYTDVTLTLSPYSPNSVTDLIKASTRKDFTATFSRGKSTGSVPFSVSCEVNAATKCYQILKQPTPFDILSFVSPTVGSAPELLPGENEYPTITETAQVQLAGISSSATIVLRTPVPDIIVGDKWTSDGAMPTADQFVQSITVDGDGNVTQFVTNTAASHSGGANLTFRSRDNYQWPLDNIEGITEGMIVLPGTNVTTNTKTAKYEDTVTLYEGTESEEKVVKNKAPFAITKNQTPTVVKGLVTVQPGNIVFNKQQKLALAGDGLRIGGYGETHIKNITGYDIKFSNLKLKLTPIKTTTTAACINSTSVVVAERAGILDNVSTVSGIGIDPTASNPIVASGAGAVSGAGTIVLNRAQNLESGATLTFAEAGQLATITGDIEIIKVGTGSPTLRFDMEKLLSIT